MAAHAPTRTLPFPQAGGEDFGLLVIEEGRSRRTAVEGELVVGRDEDCGLVLQGEGVSRRHARFAVRGRSIEVEDLASHNGTFVNRQRIVGALRLQPGDTVEVGGTCLVVHGPSGSASSSRVVTYAELAARFGEQAQVALRTGAPLAVAAFQLSKPALAPQLLSGLDHAVGAGNLVASYGWDQLVVVFGDGADPIAAVGRALDELCKVDAEARGGLAEFPRDGTRPDALLLAAREAARDARAGAFCVPGESARMLELGDRRVVIADPAMRQVYALLGRVAASALPVLVAGETGVGKENAAWAVHHLSKRATGPFLSLNCAAVQEQLVDSALFGHERGAFTGADAAHVGLFEAADGGTLFLDEVGELSAAVQAKLLRVLESQRFTRVGSTKELKVDVRIVAATNRDLEQDTASGRFRKDLFFRLSVAVVVLPPLRSRPAEIALLARRFLADACQRDGRAPMEIGASAMDRLCNHPWPGNVRELKNVMDLASAAVREAVLEAWHLPDPVRGAFPAADVSASTAARTSLADELAALERRRILEALDQARGVQTEAAALLRMPLRTLVFKLRRLRAEGSLPADRRSVLG